MAEKRSFKRNRKRIKLRYGVEQPEYVGFTEDVSASGMFIKTAKIVLPGSTIKIEIQGPDTVPIILEGRVIWGKRVPPNLIKLIKKSGMGVIITKFVAGEKIYLDICKNYAP
ncbi:PilZ domain-containing protein [Thermodesulfobacteriota bacterium]